MIIMKNLSENFDLDPQKWEVTRFEKVRSVGAARVSTYDPPDPNQLVDARVEITLHLTLKKLHPNKFPQNITVQEIPFSLMSLDVETAEYRAICRAIEQVPYSATGH